MRKYKNDIILMLLCFGVAIIFVTLFSRTTSPLYPVHFGYDSPIFETVGKYWSENSVPYVDFFDHKGPFIFWMNMLGYYLTGNATGIWLLQSIFLTVSILFIYKIVAIETTEKKVRVLFVLMTLCVLTLTYDEGNLTEEYILPFLCISTYGQLKYIKNYKETQEHSLKWGFFYGITFAIAFLTRITNAVGLLIGIIPIFIFLVKKNKVKNILLNLLFFFCGFLLLFLPFGIYFYAKDAFSEFIFGTIGFNLEYSQFTIPWWQKGKPFLHWKIFLIRFLVVYGMFLPALLAYKRKEIFKANWIMLIAVTETLFFMSGNLYPHYVTIAIINFVIILEEIRIYQPQKGVLKKFCIGLISLYLLGTVAYCIKDNVKAYKDAVSFIPEYAELVREIPQDERDSFVAYQTDRNIYLQFDIKPCYKYFILQESQAKYSLNLKRDIYDTFLRGDAEWILVCSTGEVLIQPILDKSYKVFSTSKSHQLYRHI